MTLQELMGTLNQENVRGDLVYFGDGLPTRSNQWAITNDGGIWLVYYFERGEKFGECWFADEAGACDYLWAQIRNDPTMRIRNSN